MDEQKMKMEHEERKLNMEYRHEENIRNLELEHKKREMEHEESLKACQLEGLKLHAATHEVGYGNRAITYDDKNDDSSCLIS